MAWRRAQGKPIPGEHQIKNPRNSY
jgi:hypothetical protein